MIAVIIVVVVAVFICAVLWVTTTLSPTRPRPVSRYRGPTFMEVDRRLRRRKRPKH